MKREIFGTMEPVKSSDYENIFKNTGLDVDGRRAMLQKSFYYIDLMHQFICNFLQQIPDVFNIAPVDVSKIVNGSYSSMKLSCECIIRLNNCFNSYLSNCLFF